jgi:hypothetical protein
MLGQPHSGASGVQEHVLPRLCAALHGGLGRRARRLAARCEAAAELARELARVGPAHGARGEYAEAEALRARGQAAEGKLTGMQAKLRTQVCLCLNDRSDSCVHDQPAIPVVGVPG